MRALLSWEVNEIMSDDDGIMGDRIVDVVRARQLVIRRELDRRGILLKAIALDSRVPYNTVISYFPLEKDRQPAAMPVAALYSFIGVIPADLLSLLLPHGHAIVAVPEGLDHDEVARAATEFVTAYAAARHHASESGVDIGPREDKALGGHATRLRAVA